VSAPTLAREVAAASTCRKCGWPMCRRNQKAGRGQRRHCGRGLCQHCHRVTRATEQLDEYERPSRTRDEVLDDYQLLRRVGVGRREAARRIGIGVEALDAHIFRARRDGDPRAVLGPL
jgi:hypothetical protein